MATTENIYRIIIADEHSVRLKYRQVIDSILKGIEDDRINKDDLLPSISDRSYELEISRDRGIRANKKGNVETFPVIIVCQQLSCLNQFWLLNDVPDYLAHIYLFPTS